MALRPSEGLHPTATNDNGLPFPPRYLMLANPSIVSNETFQQAECPLNQDMPRLRIIVVMIEPPLPFGNAAARWYYVLLKGLAERGYRVTAFATCSKPQEIEEAKQLFPAPAYDLRCYPHPHRSGPGAKWETLRRPYSYMFSPQFQNDLETELACGFDGLHLEQLWSGWMGRYHAHRALVNVLNLLSIDLCVGGGAACLS